MKLWEYIKTAMLRNPGQKICENDVAFTFEETVVWAELFAAKMTNIKCCAILCQSEMAAAMALLACFAADITAVPLSARYGVNHCNKILESISPDAVIYDNNGDFHLNMLSGSQYVVPNVHPALIMCTSGTTGTPKGIMLSEKNIITNVSDIVRYFDIGKDDTILIARPLYHCAVLTGEFLTALVKGGGIQFYSNAFNVIEMVQLMREYGVTTFGATPTLMDLMSKLIRNPKDISLHNLVISGECMSESVARQIRNVFPDANIYHVYGLTEASPRVAYMPPNYFDKAPDCVGLPLSSVQIEIRDDKGQLVPINKDGVLWIKGDNVMLGYYQSPDLTDMVLREGWLCTGDIACQNDRGWLKIKGRQDDLIIRAGMNIYPQEIEKEMKKDPRTHEVLVYGYEMPGHGTQIGMKIVGEYNNEREVRALCISVLPNFQVPSKIEIVTDLEKNGSGKVVRKQPHA